MAARRILALRSDQRGTSAIEFALFGGLLAFATLNVVDIAIYIYKRMEVENAAQMVNQQVMSKCNNLSDLPATTKCAVFSTAVSTGLTSTALGSSVTLQSGSPAEGYYCLNPSGALVYVSAVNSMPANCSATNMPTLTPGDYLKTTTQHTYAPLFPGLTVASYFPTPIVETSMIRLK